MDMQLLASLLDEARVIIESLPDDVYDKLQVRHYIVDELYGSALMLREEVAKSEVAQPVVITTVRDADHLAELLGDSVIEPQWCDRCGHGHYGPCDEVTQPPRCYENSDGICVAPADVCCGNSVSR